MFVNQGQGTDPVLPCNTEIISSETRGNMDNTGTILRGDKIAQSNPESISIVRLCIGKRLFIANAFKFRTLIAVNHMERYLFLSRLVFIQRETCICLREIMAQELFGQDHCYRVISIGIKGSDRKS